MSIVDLLNENKKPQNDRPSWVSNQNATRAAYDAIQIIQKEKVNFISKHHRKIDYRTKRRYLIQKSEVESLSGTTRQVLFNLSKYSAELNNYLEEVNNNLGKLKDKRLKNISRSIQSKSKPELITKAKEINQKYEALSKNTAEQQLDIAISRMSLATRKKLGID